MPKNTKPNYKKIFTDIIKKKHPEKKEQCKLLLQKKELDTLDMLQLNAIIFSSSDKTTNKVNQTHKAFYPSDIVKILQYQKDNDLNNLQLAAHFNLSRNTVSKWKKMYKNSII